jgi:hypothetical protein
MGERGPAVVKVTPYNGDTRRCPVETTVDDEVAKRGIIGSSYGWLVTINDDTWDMSLLDPFTGRSFPLPPFIDSTRTDKKMLELRYKFRFGRNMFHKAALAPGRRLGTYAVILLHTNGRGMSYLRPGATTWATLRPPRGMPHTYLDVILHKGAFYTISCYAELNVWAPDGGGSLRMRRLTNPLQEKVLAALVESRDGILMVNSRNPPNYNSYHDYREQRHMVYRCAERERVWLPVENLDEMTIVIGIKCSLCVPRGYGYYDLGGVHGSSYHWIFPY